MQCLSLAYRSMGLCLPVLGSLLGAPTLWKYVRNARLTESNRWDIKRKLLEDGGSLQAHHDSCDDTIRIANQSCHGRTNCIHSGAVITCHRPGPR